MPRRAGILVPLFSIPSSDSWGIGEIGDIPILAAWLRSAGQRILQLLPINEMPPAERSPYSALSAMGIDPQFISLRHLEDFEAIGGETRLEPELRERLERARASRTVDYASVRELEELARGRGVGWGRGVGGGGGEGVGGVRGGGSGVTEAESEGHG